jgi:hypothetical protein
VEWKGKRSGRGERGGGSGQCWPRGDITWRKQRQTNSEKWEGKGGGKRVAWHGGLCANRALGPEDAI